MKERLSKVYLDDDPIPLMGDEVAPPLSRIVRAGGKRPEDVDVVFLTSPSDAEGRPVDPAEVIDRAAEPTRPIYLRTVAHQTMASAGMPNLDPSIAQAAAEAKAEQRQEEERNHED